MRWWLWAYFAFWVVVVVWISRNQTKKRDKTTRSCGRDLDKR